MLEIGVGSYGVTNRARDELLSFLIVLVDAFYDFDFSRTSSPERAKRPTPEQVRERDAGSPISVLSTDSACTTANVLLS